MQGLDFLALTEISELSATPDYNMKKITLTAYLWIERAARFRQSVSRKTNIIYGSIDIFMLLLRVAGSFCSC